jgi:hypothetical protein
MTVTAVQPRTATATGTRTRTLLAAGAAAGPLWAFVSLTQAALRDGFDITRHPLSVLSDGDLGWLQITNFLVAGVLLVAGGRGLASRLVSVAGVGLIGAGICVMDPADGFPIGTPAGPPAAMSWHSYGHMLFGTLTFGCLIAACYVLGRRYGRSAAGVASWVAGTALLLGDLWAMGGGRYGTVTLAVGAITAMLWISTVCAGRIR